MDGQEGSDGRARRPRGVRTIGIIGKLCPIRQQLLPIESQIAYPAVTDAEPWSKRVMLAVPALRLCAGIGLGLSQGLPQEDLHRTTVFLQQDPPPVDLTNLGLEAPDIDGIAGLEVKHAA